MKVFKGLILVILTMVSLQDVEVTKQDQIKEKKEVQQSKSVMLGKDQISRGPISNQKEKIEQSKDAKDVQKNDEKKPVESNTAQLLKIKDQGLANPINVP